MTGGAPASGGSHAIDEALLAGLEHQFVRNAAGPEAQARHGGVLRETQSQLVHLQPLTLKRVDIQGVR